MAKRTTKAELVAKHREEVEILKKGNAEFYTEIQGLKKQVESQGEKISNLREENVALSHRVSFANGRTAEVIVAHDILLRTSLRQQGLSWEDIERTISESRRNFNGGDDFGIRGGRPLGRTY